jgi:hypothetical protein
LTRCSVSFWSAVRSGKTERGCSRRSCSRRSSCARGRSPRVRVLCSEGIWRYRPCCQGRSTVNSTALRWWLGIRTLVGRG